MNLKDSYLKKDFPLTPEQEKFIANKLLSKLWRLDNLYTIRDKNNIKQIMKLNSSQRRVLTKFKHNRKIILKSRQQGISTLYLAYYLDSCLFDPGYQAGIQSYGQEEATKLQKRALLMWDDMDPNIKQMYQLTLVSNNQKGMTFSNGSILKIGNFRGDTLQGLHVSELAKIAKKSPEKARELKTGAFESVSSSNKITIESTAEGQTGLFYDIWQKSANKLAQGRNLTLLDFQPIFLPWYDDPDCQLFDIDEPIEQATLEYLSTIKADLSHEQMQWLNQKLYALGDDFNQEYPATPELAFAQSLEGTYFHIQHRRLLREKRFGNFPHVPGIEVHTGWDLGVNDEMVIIFCQIVDGRPRIINAYHNTGQGIEFYASILHSLRDKYDYQYGWTILPHDIEVLEMGSGMTRTQVMRKNGISRIRVLKRIKFMDSIQVARNFIDMCEINESTASHVELSIQQYRKKYDKQIGAYLNTDVHDIHSNYMAALRYLGQGLGFTRLTRRPPPRPTSVPLQRRAYQGPRRTVGFAI